MSGILTLIGRLFLAQIFVISGLFKIPGWRRTAEMMGNEGLPLVPLLLAGAIAFEVLGGLSVAVGFRTRWGAAALIIFLIPTTLIFHDFWTFEGQQQQMQMIHFMKNVAIMGGLLVLLGHGPGAFSVDAVLAARRAMKHV